MDHSIKLTSDVLDWLKNPRSLEDGDQSLIGLVTLEAPIVKHGEEVGRAIFTPVLDPLTGEYSLHLKVQW